MNTLLPFKLFANCIPVKGINRSTICDLQRGNYDFIPNDLYEILKFQEGKTIIDLKARYDEKYHYILDEYFEFLIEKEYIFFTNNSENFPLIDLSYEDSGNISNAIIDIRKSSLSLNHKFLIKELNELGCNAIQLRLFESISISYILEIFNQNLENLQSLELIIPYKDEELEEYIELYTKINFLNQICVHSSPKESIVELDNNSLYSIVYIKDFILDSSHCGNINPGYFNSNISLFTENNNFNSCLNKKIGIDFTGNIKNCPTMNRSFGNIKTDSIKDFIFDEKFQALWKIKKDDIQICKYCEFRYICTDCRAFHEEADFLLKPKKCTYNPYSCEWE